MAKEYNLIFQDKEISETDFLFLANSGHKLFGELFKNKTALYHSNMINSELGITDKYRMINWIRGNLTGFWHVQSIDEYITFGTNTGNLPQHPNLCHIYFELESDMIAFKLRWNE